MHRRCELFKILEAVNRALHLADVSGYANSVMTWWDKCRSSKSLKFC
jgi:hypothetical protein